MRSLFIINTPGQAYTWQYVIREFLGKGHSVKILARDFEITTNILNALGFQFSTFKLTGSRYWRLFGVLRHFQSCYELSREFSPSVVMGFGLDATITASRFRKPCIVFIDGEATYIQNNLVRLLGSSIITPQCFRKTLGKKQIRINGYKELAYLHPNYFKPDPTIYDELNLRRGEKYIVLRFNSFTAIHDIGQSGFKDVDKIRLIKELERYAHIFISYEGALPKEIEGYRLSTPYARIHHVLYYANMIVTDAAMATEAAVLGTPGIICGTMVEKIGIFNELERDYGLIYRFAEPSTAITHAIKLAQQPDLKEQYVKKRQKLLSDKIDVTQFLVDFIENYPESINKYKDQGN